MPQDDVLIFYVQEKKIRTQICGLMPNMQDDFVKLT